MKKELWPDLVSSKNPLSVGLKYEVLSWGGNSHSGGASRVEAGVPLRAGPVKVKVQLMSVEVQTRYLGDS